jgi:OOP family OmpA-OmpF porin
MKKLIFALIAGATAMTAAHAQGPYVGLGISTAARYYNAPSNATNTTNDGYRASGKIFGGYDVDQTFGVELGYTDFRNSNNSYTVGTTTTTVTNGGHAWYVAGKATAPINDQFNVYGKLGLTQVHAESSLNGSDNKTGAYLGLGTEYKLNKNVGLALEYERYGKNQNYGPKPNVWTVAAKYSF